MLDKENTQIQNLNLEPIKYLDFFFWILNWKLNIYCLKRCCIHGTHLLIFMKWFIMVYLTEKLAPIIRHGIHGIRGNVDLRSVIFWF